MILLKIIQCICKYIYYRLIRYNAAKKKNEVLLENLAFANGIKLSDDESFLLFVETLRCRIIKYHLKGPKAGQQEVFIEGLPGMPDNLQSDGHGGFLVTMFITIDSEHPQLHISLAPHPYLRKMIVRLLLLMKAAFKLIDDLIPNIYVERLTYTILKGIKTTFNSELGSLILRIDASGNIMEVLSLDINSISEAHIHNDYLWFGSPWQEYISRIPLKQAFPDLANNEKLSSHIKNEKQSATVGLNSERMKRDTDSVTKKPIESKTEKVSSQTPKSITNPTTLKPTATPTVIPKPTAAPTAIPKPIAVPAKPASKVNKHTDDSNAKSSETKPAEIKDHVKPNTKPETNSQTKEDSMKINTAKSGKNIKEQDRLIKQEMPTTESDKVKPIEVNRPEDPKKK